MAAEGENDIDLLNNETFGDGAVGEGVSLSVCVCVCVTVCVRACVHARERNR